MLHGEVKVNDKVVIHWQARRTQPTPGDFNVYDCMVEQHEGGNIRSTTFTLGHWYKDGAATLASHVLRTGGHYLATHRENR